jgi:hypothetical protein
VTTNNNAVTGRETKAERFVIIRLHYYYELRRQIYVLSSSLGSSVRRGEGVLVYSLMSAALAATSSISTPMPLPSSSLGGAGTNLRGELLPPLSPRKVESIGALLLRDTRDTNTFRFTGGREGGIK